MAKSEVNKTEYAIQPQDDEKDWQFRSDTNRYGRKTLNTKDWQTDRLTDIQMDRLTGRKIDKGIDRKTNRETDG